VFYDFESSDRIPTAIEFRSAFNVSIGKEKSLDEKNSISFVANRFILQAGSENAWTKGTITKVNTVTGHLAGILGDIPINDIWDDYMNGILPEGWDRDIPFFDADPKGMATRVASGKVLNAIARQVSNLIGGSADLAPSNKTEISGEADFQADDYAGRNLRFGVREHGMGAILNGMALHGGVIPYGGTFLIFSDYMRPAIRLAALMGLNVIYVFTHDSIGVGEDGPTHQPVEQLAALRAIPGLTVIRPCDGNETAEAWKAALQSTGPVALALTRQDLPVLDRSLYVGADHLVRGAYVVKDAPDGDAPDLILIGTGSELHIALQAAERLGEKRIKVRVVSMPSWELFANQDDAYCHQVLPPEIKARIAIEAGVTQGWHRYVGDSGKVIGLNRFGASAPGAVLYEKFGFTAEHVVETALGLLQEV
ncbi:MAG: transketolase C-terminal domain-containing protein, partial [Candidatus Desulfacyla sp.]